MSKFSHFPRQVKHVRFPRQVKHVRFNFVLEGDLKNIFYYQRDIENHTDQALNFCYLIDMNIYTQNLLVCNSCQHAYVTDLCNFFFVLQDLIDRINSYFQRIAFRRNLLLIGF